jgi:hypothetical protein
MNIYIGCEFHLSTLSVSVQAIRALYEVKIILI